jgi:glycosyltransferase involved in cell wall biosynthesis
MRVLLVSDWYPPDLGGVGRHTENLARALTEKGHQALVVAPALNFKASQQVEHGVEVLRLPAVLSPYHADILRVSPWPRRRLTKLLDQWQPDVVHVQTPLTLGYNTLKAAQKRHIPAVFTYHIFIYHSKGKWWRPFDLAYWKYWRYLFRMAQVVTVPSQSSIDYLQQDYGPLQLTLLPNGIDLSQYGHQDVNQEQAKSSLGLTGKMVFFFASRMSPEKRLEDAIAGLNQVADPNLVFVIAGDGPQKGQLQNLINKLGETRVTFAGQLDKEQVKRYYEAADACLFPSPVENHSIAMLESLSYGLPILGANAGGIGGTITDGQDGLLYPPNQPDRVAEAIKKFLAMSPQQKQAMRQAAQKTAQQFGYQTVVLKYLDVYQKVIDSYRPAKLPSE